MSIEIGSLYKFNTNSKEIIFFVLEFKLLPLFTTGNGEPVYLIKGITTFGREYEYNCNKYNLDNIEKIA